MNWAFRSLGPALMLAASTAALAEGPPRASRPNVVYILADDLGYGDVKRLNPSGKIATPVLDRLASEGVTFTDAHSGSAVCSPTRYGLLTGRYAWRSSLKRGVLGGYSPPLIEPGRLDRPRVPGLARIRDGVRRQVAPGDDLATSEKGRRSSATATRRNHGSTSTGRSLDGPLTKGFGAYFGISASLDMPPYVFIDGDRLVARPTGPPGEGRLRPRRGQGPELPLRPRPARP